jgi:hypothetical protein
MPATADQVQPAASLHHVVYCDRRHKNVDRTYERREQGEWFGRSQV